MYIPDNNVWFWIETFEIRIELIHINGRDIDEALIDGSISLTAQDKTNI